MAKRDSKEEFYWPLGLIGYGSEIEELYPEEALKLGVITILWNHHEECLRHIFAKLFDAKLEPFADALWDRQPTHHAKRNALALALTHCELTPHQRLMLEWVIDKTKAFADRRNDLIHGIYEVHAKTSQLFARNRSPNSKKTSRQRSTQRALTDALTELETLMQVAEQLSIEMIDPEGKLMAEMTRSYEAFQETRRAQPQSPQTDSPPPSDHQRPKPKRKRRPSPSAE